MGFLNYRFILLLPFSAIFYLITGIRNLLFDKGFLSAVSFKIPVISVGNLAVGGTGKTPHTEFILSVLQNQYRCAVLSRGYKRLTKGYVEADNKTGFEIIGDEPLQIFSKFPDVVVAVDEKRVHGINTILNQHPETDAIILDDAFQHRQVKPGLSILLTSYNRLFTRDSILPGGRLRESRKNFKRADILIVTKCPESIGEMELQQIRDEIQPNQSQHLFFSSLHYGQILHAFVERNERSLTFDDLRMNQTEVLLVTGIASSVELTDKIKTVSENPVIMQFRDHHIFSENDIREIEKRFDQLTENNKIILTTEKDLMRFKENKFIGNRMKEFIYYVPIKIKILDNKEDTFNKTITDYVGKN